MSAPFIADLSLISYLKKVANWRCGNESQRTCRPAPRASAIAGGVAQQNKNKSKRRKFLALQSDLITD